MPVSTRRFHDAARRALRSEGAWALALLLLVSLPDLTPSIAEPTVTAATITVHPMDVLAAVAVLLGAIRWARAPRWGAATAALLLVWVLLLVGIGSGVWLYGLQAPVNMARGMVYALAALTYALTTRRDWARSDLLGLVPATAILVVLCVVRIASDGILIRADSAGSADQIDLRPVSAPGALLLLVVAILLLTSSHRIAAWQWVGAGAFLLLLIVVQQRTVWFCLPVCLVTWLVASWLTARQTTASGEPGVSRRLLLIIGGALAAGVAVILAVPALRRSASDGGTFTWRVHQWQDGISTFSTPLQWLIGVPRGTLRRFWAITLPDGRALYKPPTGLTTHSFYVDTLLHVGILGLASLLLLMVLAASWRRRHAWVTAAGMVTLVAALLVYGVTYFLPTFAFFLIGMGLWGTTRRSTAP